MSRKEKLLQFCKDELIEQLFGTENENNLMNFLVVRLSDEGLANDFFEDKTAGAVVDKYLTAIENAIRNVAEGK